MEQFFYTETMTVMNADADFRSLLKPSALLRYVEQISTDHARAFGMDDQFFKDRGVTFLVGKQALKFDRVPQRAETLTLTSRAQVSKHGSVKRITTLTDAEGRMAVFSNTIFLLTSTLGARCLAGQASPLGFGAAAEETARRGKKALQEAKDYFRPELMGRLDDVVLFDPLGPAQLAAIADRLLCELEERAARQGYTLRHTPAAAAALAGDTVPAYGARELRRKVSRAVEQALAARIAAGTARPGVLFVADAAPDGHITLTMGDVAACAS